MEVYHFMIGLAMACLASVILVFQTVRRELKLRRIQKEILRETAPADKDIISSSIMAIFLLGVTGTLSGVLLKLLGVSLKETPVEYMSALVMMLIITTCLVVTAILFEQKTKTSPTSKSAHLSSLINPSLISHLNEQIPVLHQKVEETWVNFDSIELSKIRTMNQEWATFCKVEQEVTELKQKYTLDRESKELARLVEEQLEQTNQDIVKLFKDLMKNLAISPEQIKAERKVQIEEGLETFLHQKAKMRFERSDADVQDLGKILLDYGKVLPQDVVMELKETLAVIEHKKQEQKQKERTLVEEVRIAIEAAKLNNGITPPSEETQ